MIVGRRGRTAVACVVVAVAMALGACSDTGEKGSADTTVTTQPVAASTLSLATTREPAVDLPGYAVYRPSDLSATGAPLPLVVWANGGCTRADEVWATLLHRWASAGFVVVAISPAPEGESAPGFTSAADQARGIEWAETQNAKPDSPYSGRLDTTRVVAAGNSCGGITSLALAGMDPRVKAVFVLSGSSVGPGASREQAAAVMTKVHVPVGLISGGAEDIASDQTLQDYELLAEGVPGFRASRASGDHVTVSIDKAVLEEVGQISVNWLDLAVNGNEAALDALLTDPCITCAPGLWTVQSKNLESLTT